nr:hypothetical protein [Paenibacillus protaetiae]
MGLSIVKSIAHKYKGQIQVEASSPDTLQFIVRIPQS